MEKKCFLLNWISRYRDELFGIAILSVLLLHFSILHVDHYRGSHSASFLIVRWFRRFFTSSGVDIFTFLSGMGLYYSFSKNGNIKSFYCRRYRRILIPYAIVGGIYWTHVDLFSRLAGVRRLILDFLYITFFTEGANNLWFVFFIGSMYLIFPPLFFLFFRTRNGKQWRFLIFTASVMMPVVMYQLTPKLYENINIAVTRVPVFVAGMIAGKYIREEKTIPHASALGIIIAGCFFRYYIYLHHIKGCINRYSASMFAISVILICIYCLRLLDGVKSIRTVLRLFGKYSLEFYLLHILMWHLLGEAHWKLYEPAGYSGMICVCALLVPVLDVLTKSIIRITMMGHRSTDQA